MKGREVFSTKRTFDLEKAIPLAEVREDFVLNDFEIYFSKKYECYFTVIETAEGKLYYSWSKVIADKFKAMANLPAEEWKGLALRVVKRRSKNGRFYISLEAV